MDAYTACSIAEGFCNGQNATREEQIEAWQYIKDTKLYLSLQGWYGRTVQRLLNEGIIN